MPEKIIHLDSKNATYIVNTNNTTANVKNSFHANFKLTERFTNIKKNFTNIIRITNCIQQYSIRFNEYIYISHK